MASLPGGLRALQGVPWGLREYPLVPGVLQRFSRSVSEGYRAWFGGATGVSWGL